MLYENPPHLVSLYSVATTNQASGGASTTPALIHAACPCLINTASANTQEMYAQKQIRVTDTIGILSSTLDETPKPGWKAIADDTGQTFIIRGIRSGRVSALGTIPPLTYLDCETWL